MPNDSSNPAIEMNKMTEMNLYTLLFLILELIGRIVNNLVGYDGIKIKK